MYYFISFPSKSFERSFMNQWPLLNYYFYFTFFVTLICNVSSNSMCVCPVTSWPPTNENLDTNNFIMKFSFTPRVKFVTHWIVSFPNFCNQQENTIPCLSPRFLFQLFLLIILLCSDYLWLLRSLSSIFFLVEFSPLQNRSLQMNVEDRVVLIRIHRSFFPTFCHLFPLSAFLYPLLFSYTLFCCFFFEYTNTHLYHFSLSYLDITWWFLEQFIYFWHFIIIK